MKSPEKFDYILWTAVEGAQKHYWVKVKRTGEICEVDYEVMRFCATRN